LSFYAPIQTKAAFSKNFGNVLEQDYIEDTSNYFNVCYVGDKLEYNATIKDLERREVYISANDDATADSLVQEAKNTLNEKKKTRTLSSVLDAYSEQFVYLTDWNIASIVQNDNEIVGYSEKEVIVEITEFYDSRGFNLEVLLGDYF